MRARIPSLTALLGLLAIAGYQNRDKIAEMLGRRGRASPKLPGKWEQWLPRAADQGSGRRQRRRHPQRWVGRTRGAFQAEWPGGHRGLLGQDRPEQADTPAQLEQALGPEVDDLSKQTGLSREELVSRLCRELPDAVDKYAP